MWTWPPREMYRKAHSFIIYKSLKLEAIQSINGRMGKYIMAQTRNGGYLTMKMNKLLLYTAWMDLGNCCKKEAWPKKIEHIIWLQIYKTQKQEKLNYNSKAL